MKALCYALLGFFSFTLMDVSIKWLLQSYGLIQVTFINSSVALIGIFIWIAPNFNHLKTQQALTHVVRSVLILFIDLLAFYSYGKTSLPEAYTLILTMPIFIILFSIFFRLETWNINIFISMLIGFSGVMLVLSPNFKNLNLALFAALASAAIEALSFILINKSKDKDSPQAFAFYGLLLVVLVTGTISILDFKPMNFSSIAISVSGGVCYALASCFVVSAFHLAPASFVSSFQYSQLLWGIVFSFVLWNQTPSENTLLGAILIIICGVYILKLRNKEPYSDTRASDEHSQ